MSLIVGTPSSNYAYTRNVLNLVPDVHYRRTVDVNRVVSAAAHRVNQMMGRPMLATGPFEGRASVVGTRRYDILHLFNAISLAEKPWITTFETVVPRFSRLLACHHGPEPHYDQSARSPEVRRALESVSGSACKHIIALSSCTAAIQRELLKSFPEVGPCILQKMSVLHPPQVSVLSAADRKPTRPSGDIGFMLVGHQFFSKGGRETVEVLSRMRRRYRYPIHLKVVSSLIPDPYASHTNLDDVRDAKKLLSENSDWIDYFPRLSGDEVIKQMMHSHIGLLPTYADTYGYSVLEFQAAGCPVISTNIRALPEINSEECGWMIDVPKNRLGEALYTTRDSREELSSTIRLGLERAVHEIFAERECVMRKCEASLQRIARDHSPSDFADKLRLIYENACG